MTAGVVLSVRLDQQFSAPSVGLSPLLDEGLMELRICEDLAVVGLVVRQELRLRTLRCLLFLVFVLTDTIDPVHLIVILLTLALSGINSWLQNVFLIDLL